MAERTFPAHARLPGVGLDDVRVVALHPDFEHRRSRNLASRARYDRDAAGAGPPHRSAARYLVRDSVDAVRLRPDFVAVAAMAQHAIWMVVLRDGVLERHLHDVLHGCPDAHVAPGGQYVYPRQSAARSRQDDFRLLGFLDVSDVRAIHRYLVWRHSD